MKRLKKFIPKGSLILSVTSLISYILGLARDHYFAQTFGATRTLDAYNAAFLFPDLLFNILIAGGIAAAFIPILTDILHSNKEKANDYINSVITASTATMALSAIIIVIFADAITFLVAPGFAYDDRMMVAKILRVLAFSPILFAVSNTLGAMLITKKRFLFYGLSPILYNLGIIMGTIFLVPTWGVMGVAIGSLLGASFHLLARIYDAWKQGFRIRPHYDFKSPEFKKTIKLMIPKMFGHPIELATFWGFTAIASNLTPGSVAIVNFARNFQSVPISLIGITIATTSFPILSSTISRRKKGEFINVLKKSFWLIFSLSILSAIFIFTIRQPLITLFLGGGAFDSEDIQRTAATLAVFCLSIPTEASAHLLVRAFYATKNTITPVLVSIVGILIAIPGGYFLSTSYGILALPLAFFLGSIVKVLILSILLPIYLKRSVS